MATNITISVSIAGKRFSISPASATYIAACIGVGDESPDTDELGNDAEMVRQAFENAALAAIDSEQETIGMTPEGWSHADTASDSMPAGCTDAPDYFDETGTPID